MLLQCIVGGMLPQDSLLLCVMPTSVKMLILPCHCISYLLTLLILVFKFRQHSLSCLRTKGVWHHVQMTISHFASFEPEAPACQRSPWKLLHGTLRQISKTMFYELKYVLSTLLPYKIRNIPVLFILIYIC